MLKELRKKVRSANPETPEDLKNILRRWKYREFLRISIRDFCLPEAFVETLEFVFRHLSQLPKCREAVQEHIHRIQDCEPNREVERRERAMWGCVGGGVGGGGSPGHPIRPGRMGPGIFGPWANQI